MSQAISLGPQDRVIVKQLWKFPVPTAYEVKLLFDALEDYSPEIVGLGIMVVDGLRPIEVTRLTWPRLMIEDAGVREICHFINKPAGKQTRRGKNFEEKEIRKPVLEWSKWLSDQIIGYAKIAASYEGQHCFQWTSSDGLCKYLRYLRDEIQAHPEQYGSEYACFFDKNSYVKIGPNQPIPYRINPYSLRRFSITFHHYTTCGGDPIKTAKMFGHSAAATTLGHYIMPKEAIGLTQQMIDAKITIDEFIHLYGRKQMRILDFDPRWEKRFTPVGQKTLGDFAMTEIELDF